MVAAVAALAWPSAAAAQYFGQNKVRHKDMAFKVLATQHFDVHYYDEKREAAEQAGRMAERWYARLSAILGHQLSSRQPLVLYASHPDFRSTTVVPGSIGETTGGLTDGLRRRIVMPLASSLSETDHVLGHELVHAFQFDMTRGGSSGPQALRLPLWFVEGMAEYLSLGPVDPHTAMWVRDAVAREALPSISELDDPRFFPYRWGHAFWAYVAGRHGDRIVAPLLVAAAASGDPEAALREVLGVEAKQLSADWHAALIQAAAPVLAASASPGRSARPLFTSEKGGGRLNLAPMLSPDGRHVVFYSERDLLSIDLFLADATTGRLIRKLTETAVAPHVDSLQFAYAAGGWDAQGSRFAFGSVNAGRAELSVYDLGAGRVTRRYPLQGVAELFSLSWSPDGRSMVLSGMSNGQTDLFRLEVQGGEVSRLTNDLFADLQPAWSPDGRTIAFSTDRFGSDLSTLAFGPPRLALFDVATGGIREVQGSPGAKHVGPQWAPDGSALFFLSDRGGVPNIYRVALADGRLEQATNLQTGVSGISALSPAFSVARCRPAPAP
jgi:Tol biopolymer transport system component